MSALATTTIRNTPNPELRGAAPVTRNPARVGCWSWPGCSFRVLATTDPARGRRTLFPSAVERRLFPARHSRLMEPLL